jgi:Predicted dehydrogenases and related proteins
MEIDIGIVGAGIMGRNHARVCSTVKGVKLAGVCDICAEKSRQLAEKYGTICYTDYKDLTGNVNAVVIAVQTGYHYEIARFFLENNVHVLLEKPVTSTVQQAMELTALAENKKLKLAVGHVERFNSAYRVLKEILKNEEIITIEINRMSNWDDRVTDIDVVLDLMIHDMDLVTDLAGHNIKQMYSLGKRVKDNSRFFDYDTVLLEFENGIIGKLTASRITEQKIREIKINAVRKYIVVDLLKKDIDIFSRTRFEEMSKGGPVYLQENIIEKVSIPGSESLYDEICDFRDSILFDRKPEVTGADGTRALDNVLRVLKGT